MTDFIKRIVFPRDTHDDRDSGWMFGIVPLFDVSLSPGTEQSNPILFARKPLDVRTHITAPPDWISWLEETPRQVVPSATQLNLGFQQPQAKKLHPSYHAPWIDDLGWIFDQTEQVGYTDDMFSAISSQTNSFRTQRYTYSKPGRSGAPRPRIHEGVAPAQQLFESYLSSINDKYKFSHYAWDDDHAAAIFTSPDFSAELWPAIQQLISDRIQDSRSRTYHRHDSLWNTLSRSIAVLFEDVEIVAPVWSQQFDSFMLRRPVIWPAVTVCDPDLFSVIDAIYAEELPTREQLLSGFVTSKRKSVWPSDDPDVGWLFNVGQFPSELWPSLESSINSFRQLERPKLDVRRLDTLFDAYVSYEELFNVPGYTGPLVQSAESFRMPNRRITMDSLRIEDFHDFAWMRAVLDLIDAPSDIPRAHWRHIEGAIRARRRKRRGR